MADLLEVIKKVVHNTLENKKLTDIAYGKVESISPLTVRLDQKLLLTKEFLIVTDSFKNKVINGITIDNELKVGDKLIMLRVQEGQKYLLLSKVV